MHLLYQYIGILLQTENHPIVSSGFYFQPPLKRRLRVIMLNL